MANMTEDRSRHYSSSDFPDGAAGGCSPGFCDMDIRVCSHRKRCWHIDLRSRHRRRRSRSGKTEGDHGDPWRYAYL